MDDNIIEIIKDVSMNTQTALLNISSVLRLKLSIKILDSIVIMKLITPAPKFPY